MLKIGHAERADWPSLILGGFGLAVVLPLTALIIGTSVLGAEIDDGSVVHLLATPVPRSTVVLTKFPVAATLTIIFAAIPELVAGLIATGGATRLAIGLLAGALVASVIYNALFVMISVLTTRAIAIGLLYLLVWESLLGNLVSGVGVLSVGQYSLSIAKAIARREPERASHRDHRDGDGRAGHARSRGAGDLPGSCVLDPGRRGLTRVSRGGVRAGPEGRAVAGDDHRGHGQDPGPAVVQRGLVGAERVVGRAVRAPPGVRAGVHPPGVAASVVMSSVVWPGVASSRTDGLSSKSLGSRLIHRSPS